MTRTAVLLCVVSCAAVQATTPAVPPSMEQLSSDRLQNDVEEALLAMQTVASDVDRLKMDHEQIRMLPGQGDTARIRKSSYESMQLPMEDIAWGADGDGDGDATSVSARHRRDEEGTGSFSLQPPSPTEGVDVRDDGGVQAMVGHALEEARREATDVTAGVLELGQVGKLAHVWEGASATVKLVAQKVSGGSDDADKAATDDSELAEAIKKLDHSEDDDWVAALT